MKLGYLQKLSLIDYPQKLCATVFTVGCNFRCHYCHNPELVQPKADLPLLSLDDLFAFLQRRVGLLDGVTITGGEPTLQPDLPDFCRRIKASGFLVKCDTNGYNPNALRELIAAGVVDYLAMDIKAPLSRYREVVGVDIDPQIIAESVQLLKSSLCDYEFRTTVVAGDLNLADFVEMGKLVAGASSYFLQGFVASKTLDGAYTKRVAPSAEAMREFQQILSTYVSECHIR